MNAKKQKNGISAPHAPFHDGKAAEPHYEDVISPDAIRATPAPTPPGAEPMTAGSMKTPDNVSAKTNDMTPSARPPKVRA